MLLNTMKYFYGNSCSSLLTSLYSFCIAVYRMLMMQMVVYNTNMMN